MQKISFVDADGKAHVLQVEPGHSVMQVAIENDVRGILADCGGSRSCATCHCYLDAPWALRFAPASVEELELVLQDHDPEGNAEVAFGDELVGRRRRDDGGLPGAGATAAGSQPGPHSSCDSNTGRC